MATATTPGFNTPPQQSQGGASAPQQGQGMQGPAPAIMQLLGGWFKVSQEIGQFHPQIAPQMNKVGQAVQESLMILARQTNGQQEGGLPTQDSAASPTPQQSPTY